MQFSQDKIVEDVKFNYNSKKKLLINIKGVSFGFGGSTGMTNRDMYIFIFSKFKSI